MSIFIIINQPCNPASHGPCIPTFLVNQSYKPCLGKWKRNKTISNLVQSFRSHGRTNISVIHLYLYLQIKISNLPPVTSHIASMGDESEGTRPVSLSTAGVPASLSTNENNLWSHLNGSRVNSDPGIGQFIGKLN